MALPQRVAVVGNSGSGKSTLARELARCIDAEHIELDAIHHQPDWTPMERDEMRRVVSARTAAAERWVVEGNYGAKTLGVRGAGNVGHSGGRLGSVRHTRMSVPGTYRTARAS